MALFAEPLSLFTVLLFPNPLNLVSTLITACCHMLTVSGEYTSLPCRVSFASCRLSIYCGRNVEYSGRVPTESVDLPKSAVLLYPARPPAVHHSPRP